MEHLGILLQLCLCNRLGLIHLATPSQGVDPWPPQLQRPCGLKHGHIRCRFGGQVHGSRLVAAEGQNRLARGYHGGFTEKRGCLTMKQGGLTNLNGSLRFYQFYMIVLLMTTTLKIAVLEFKLWVYPGFSYSL